MATTLANISIKDNSSWNTYLNLIYPVGSIYIAYTSTSPATRFGGTWSQISSRFLYCTTGVGTGGSNTHTLTVNEIPSHNHALKSEGAYDQESWPAGLYWSNASAGNLWRVWSTEGLGAGSDGRLYIDYQGGGNLTTTCLHTKAFTVGGELPRFSGVGDINAYSC